MQDIVTVLLTLSTTLASVIGLLVWTVRYVVQKIVTRHIQFLTKVELNLEKQTEYGKASAEALSVMMERERKMHDMHKDPMSTFSTILTNRALKELVEARKLEVSGSPKDQVLSHLDRAIGILDARKA